TLLPQPISKFRTASPTTLVDSSGSSRLPPVDRISDPNGPAPSLHTHYRCFTTTTSRSASTPRIGTQRLAVLAAWRAPSRCRSSSIGTCLPTFRANAADQAHVVSMPDTAWPEVGTPARLIPVPKRRPGFDVICFHFDTS